MNLSQSDIQAIAKEVAKELAAILESRGQPQNELNAKGVADLLGLSVPTIERLTASGEIPSYKIGRSRRYNRDLVLQAIQAKDASRN